ncbi:gamma-interferon-inducible lysosomal thiol reductase-like [Penaeus chinensis]|uniref:gamma-interferon-inducible lysosomal thiol reductase-like n=1 Tax=Penaeus chinensis TaxID=139456 RepID=UPI001FB587FF|nr:gamma-interferon-inducible lysosomal thiol reductase-like [Penaeus chinensis]
MARIGHILLVFLSALVFAPAATLEYQNSNSQNAIEADPVRVMVYLETLCPDSINFVVNQLVPARDSLTDIMAVNITAYGFASDQPSGDGYVFECQHGPGECKGNMIVVCAKKYLDHETYVDFTLCLMSGFYPPIEGEKCAERVEVEWQPIDNCSQSVEGEQLLHEAGLEQGLLDPRPDWMPWIILNDVFTQENQHDAQEDLIDLVCRSYQGEKPEACPAETML